MSTLQTILPLLKEAINDVQQAQSMNSAKAPVLSTKNLSHDGQPVFLLKDGGWFFVDAMFCLFWRPLESRNGKKNHTGMKTF